MKLGSDVVNTIRNQQKRSILNRSEAPKNKNCKF